MCIGGESVYSVYSVYTYQACLYSQLAARHAGFVFLTCEKQTPLQLLLVGWLALAALLDTSLARTQPLFAI